MRKNQPKAGTQVISLGKPFDPASGGAQDKTLM